MSTELAAALGVTDQTVRNWRDAGMRPCGRRPDALGRNRDVWRLGEARAWKVRNRPAGQDGGKRAGAGRKRKAKSEKRKSEPAAAGQTTLEDAEKEKTSEQLLKGAALRRFRGNAASEADLELLYGLNEKEGGIALVDEKARKERIDADRADLELRARRGELVDAAEVARDVARMVALLKGRHAALSQKAAAVLGAELSLNSGQVALAREVLEGLVEAVQVEIAEASVSLIEVPVMAVSRAA